MPETKQTPPANASANQPRPFPAIIDVGSFMAMDLPLPFDLIPGILHQSGKLALGGGSKTFKTWNLACLACALATGTDWLNWRCRQSRVLYVNFRHRLARIRDAQHLTFDPNSLEVWNLRGYSGGARDIVPRITERTKAAQRECVIIDPLYKLYGDTDENSASSVANLLNEVEKLTVDTSAACVFGAHYSKGNQANKEMIDRISGSGVFGRDPDSILNFTPHKETDCFTVEGVFRNHPPMKPFVVHWECPVFVVQLNLDPYSLKQVSGRPAKYSINDLIELLAQVGRPLSTMECCALAKSELGMSKPTFMRYVPALRKCPAVTHNSGGNWTFNGGLTIP